MQLPQVLKPPSGPPPPPSQGQGGAATQPVGRTVVGLKPQASGWCERLQRLLLQPGALSYGVPHRDAPARWA